MKKLMWSVVLALLPVTAMADCAFVLWQAQFDVESSQWQPPKALNAFEKPAECKAQLAHIEQKRSAAYWTVEGTVIDATPPITSYRCLPDSQQP